MLVAVAGALMTSVVAFVTLTMVAPAGMPGPLIAAPTCMPVVLATVTLALLTVVAPPVRVFA